LKFLNVTILKLILYLSATKFIIIQKTPAVSFVNFPLDAEERFLIASAEIVKKALFANFSLGTEQ